MDELDNTGVDFARRYDIPKLYNEGWDGTSIQPKDGRRELPITLKDRMSIEGVGEPLGGSPMDYIDKPLSAATSVIRRFHSTPISNLRDIFKRGLKKSFGDDDVVYTSVRPNAFQKDGFITLELSIPKDEYRTLNRLNYNPSHVDALGWEDVADDVHDIKDDLWLGDGLITKWNAKEFKSVPQHGRTDVIADDIKPEYITIADSKHQRYDIDPREMLDAIKVEREEAINRGIPNLSDKQLKDFERFKDAFNRAEWNDDDIDFAYKYVRENPWVKHLNF